MPAIEFSRLRTKIELLGRVYDQPGQFVKDLSDLYFFYSDLTFQNNNPYVKMSAFPAYRTPVVINRELERSLKTEAGKRPEETLNIIDALWATRTLEPCHLAAALLGAMPIQYAEAVLERILNWSQTGENPELVNALQTRSTETLRREKPELWLQTLRHWYDSKKLTAQKLAVMGLIPMIDDPNFNNLPLIFDYLQPIVAASDSHLVYTLLTIVEKLAVKSESETVFFLKQIIKDNKSDDLPRFIRRALPVFSNEAQQSLKTCLRENPLS